MKRTVVFDVSGTATITTLTCTVDGKETTETGDGPSTQSMNGDFSD